LRGARSILAEALGSLGFDISEVETPLHPVLIARRRVAGEAPHVLCYGHYDVQPAAREDGWDTDPFDPVIKDNRLYGRGAADNKGPLMTIVGAVARLLAEDPNLPLNLTFLIEGEEEIGSPSFVDFIEAWKEELSADFILLSDTASPSRDQLGITTGIRGILYFDVIVQGPKFDLHSGFYGGGIVNPVHALSQVIASLHDADGRVNVPGFYDQVVAPTDWDRAQIAQLGVTDEALMAETGVSGLLRQPGLTPAEAIRLQPTLELNGIGGGYQGDGSKTIIPGQVRAKISCRLVANQEVDPTLELVQQTIRERMPEGVSVSFVRHHDGPPYRVYPPDHPNAPADANPVLNRAFRAADRAAREIFPKPPVYSCEGGSIPIIGDLNRVLGIDAVMPGLITGDSQIHGPNESLHLDLFHRGLDLFTAILRDVAAKRD
jgi:acetylornithine deacetylase/succinyl-diaminopimelate desuccinylase-like protein